MAFGLTLFAGMATAIGSIIAFTAKRTNYRFLSIATGFSAGVMLYVSFVEIFFKGADSLVERFGEAGANWVNAASFFGVLLTVLTMLTSFLGSPREPPPGMSWEQFQQWINSGAWFKESITTSVSCILIPAIIAGVITHVTRGREQKTINQESSHSV